MSVNERLTLSKYSRILAIIVPMIAGNKANIAEARQLNAGFILNEMEPKQQHSFVIGIVEGLAYSRFLKERPDETGMSLRSQLDLQRHRYALERDQRVLSKTPYQATGNSSSPHDQERVR